MTVRTKYNRGDRVLMWSEDYQRHLKGKVASISITIDANGTDIEYEITADEVIKSSVQHFAAENIDNGDTYIVNKIK